MTKKDFVLVASALSEAYNSRDKARNMEAQTFALNAAVVLLSNKLADANVRFDRNKFLKAAGLRLI